MIIIIVNTILSVCPVLFFSLLFLLLLAMDECFTALQSLAHDLDPLMGSSYSYKQTHILVIMSGGTMM